MPRALLITNPAAARTDVRAVHAVQDVLRRGGWSVEATATTASGDARRLAELARTDGMEAVLCYGGDGTAMQAAAALAGGDVPLGIIPGGTGNLLAGNLRLPRRPVAAARAILRGVSLAIDLGTMQRADGLHCFAVCCGAGFDATLMARTNSAAKRRWRMGAYVQQALTALGQVTSVHHRIMIDGAATRLEAAMVLVCNCAELLPPLLRLHPEIRPDDGVLDVVALRAEGAWQSVTAFVELLMGGTNQVWFGRGTEVTVEVETGPAQPVQLDGEVAGETPFTARVLPRALRVFVDPDTVPGGVRPGQGRTR